MKKLVYTLNVENDVVPSCKRYILKDVERERPKN